MIALVMIVLGIIFANSSFGQNDSNFIQKLPILKASDRDGMYHTKIDGTPLYGSKKKPIRFKYIGDFQIVDGDTIAVAENFDKKFFHISLNGKPAYTQKYNSVSEFTNGFAIAENDLGCFHIRKDGKKIQNEKIFYKVRPFYNGLAAVENDDGDCFHIDTEGNPIYKKKYLSVGDFNLGCAWVQDSYDERFYLINQFGDKILGDNSYKSIIADPNENGKFIAKNDSVTFIITIDEKDNTVRMLIVENPKRNKK